MAYDRNEIKCILREFQITPLKRVMGTPYF